MHTFIIIKGKSLYQNNTNTKQLLQDTGQTIKGDPLLRGRCRRITVRCVAVSQEQNLLFLGSGDNVVSVYEISVMNRKYICEHYPTSSEVQAIECLSPNPFFACTDSSGGVHIWSVASSEAILLHRFVANHPLSESYSPSITHLSWLGCNNWLYASDSTGMVSVYTIKFSTNTSQRRTILAEVLTGTTFMTGLCF